MQNQKEPIEHREVSLETEKSEGSQKEKPFSFKRLWGELKKLLVFGTEKGKAILEDLKQGSEKSEYPSAVREELKNLQEEANAEVLGLNLAIEREGKEAKQELASLIGEVSQLLEGLLPTALNKIVHYDVSKTPEGFLNKEERDTLAGIIDIGRIKEAAKDWKDYICGSLKSNDVVLLGEAHTAEVIEKKMFEEVLKQAKAENPDLASVGLEIEEYYQPYFDRYKEKGLFQETDNPDDYEKIEEYQHLKKEWYRRNDDKSLDDLCNFEKPLEENFLFRHSLYDFYYIAKKAKELKIDIVCLDRNQTGLTDPNIAEELNQAAIEEIEKIRQRIKQERNSTMFNNICRAVVQNGKMLGLMGSKHLLREGYEHENQIYKSLAGLLTEEKSIKSHTVNIDRDLDVDCAVLEAKRMMPNARFNSILFTTLEEDPALKEKSIGFDLSKDILKKDEIEDVGDGLNFPFDGYVRIAS